MPPFDFLEFSLVYYKIQSEYSLFFLPHYPFVSSLSHCFLNFKDSGTVKTEVSLSISEIVNKITNFNSLLIKIKFLEYLKEKVLSGSYAMFPPH